MRQIPPEVQSVHEAPLMRLAGIIRLTESTTSQWAHNLREAAKEPIVSPRLSPVLVNH